MDIYIGVDGKDSNGGKIPSDPLKTFSAAVEKASDNDTIIFLPGTHMLTMTKDDTACIHDEKKSLTITGCGIRSILKVDNPDVTFRDIHFLQLFNPKSRLMNCTVDYNVTTRSSNYSRSIFGHGSVKGNVYNVNFIIRSRTSFSYDSHNLNDMTCFNCTFTILDGIEDSYSGNKVNFEKCAFKGIAKFLGGMTGQDNQFNVDLNELFQCKHMGYGIYYGQYREIIRKYLLKKNDQFYTVKQETYDINKDKFREVKKDFNKFGFYLDDLFKPIESFNYPCYKENILLTNEILGFDNNCEFLLSKNNEFYTIKSKPKILNALGTYKAIGKSASDINAIFNPNTKLSNTYYWDDGFSAREGLSIEFGEKIIINKIELYGCDRFPLGNVKFELDGNAIYAQTEVSENKPMIFEGFACGKRLDVVRYLIKDSVIQKIVVYGIELKDIQVEKGNEFIDGDNVSFLNYLPDKTDFKLVLKDNNLPVNLKLKLDKMFRPIDKFKGKIELLRQTKK